jgi:hypothetical protein
LEPKKKKEKIIQVNSRKYSRDDTRVLPLMMSRFFSFENCIEINTKPDKKESGTESI